MANVKQDLPRSPVNYSDELKQATELRLKNTPLTVGLPLNFESASSGIIYSTTDGEFGLLNLLYAVPDVANSIIGATDWNRLDYQTPTVVGQELRLLEPSLNRVFVYIDVAVSGGSITISYDGGVTSKPLVDVNEVAVTSLAKGYYEFYEGVSDFYLILNYGDVLKLINESVYSPSGNIVLTRVGDVLTEVNTSQNGTLYKKETLNRSAGVLVSVNVKIYQNDGVSILYEYNETLNRSAGVLQSVTKVVV